MRGKAKWSILVSILLVLSLFLSACSGNSNATNGNAKDKANKPQLAAEQTLNFTSAADIPTLDLPQATDTTSFGVLGMVKSGLMTIYNNKLVPDLAKAEPDVNADGTVYTFHLRDGIKYSDGSPVTAQDFVWSWQHEIDPKTASPYNYIVASANIKNAAKIMDKNSDICGKVDQLGVKALDDKTLQVTLDKPTPYFLSLMSFATFFPLKKDFVEKQGDHYAKEPENLLYNGPYVLKSWQHGVGWTLEKNPDYWDAKNITIKEVNYKVVKDTTTALNLYKTDQIYEDPITGEYVDRYKNNPEFHTEPGNCVFYLTLNFAKVKAFKNLKLRQAIAMSIDREDMVNVLLNDGSVPAHFLVPKQFTFDKDGKDFRVSAPKGYLLDGKDKAKQLWEEAKKELGIQKLDLTFNTTDIESRVKYTEYIVNQIEKTLPGIHITINKQPWGEYLKLSKEGNFDINGGSGWCPDYQDPMTFLDLFVSDPPNDGKWADPKYDKMIDEARNLGNKPAERWAKLQEAEKYLITQAPVIPLYQNGDSYLVKPYVKGMVFESYGPSPDYRHAKIYKH